MHRRQVFVLLVILSVFAAVHQVVSGNQPPAFITAEELKAKVNSAEPVVILDVRGSETYANSTSRIKGALHVSVRKLKYRLSFAPLKDIPKNRPVVIYCACPSDEASIQAVQILQETGFKDVRVLKGGWNEWQKVRGPVEQRPRS